MDALPGHGARLLHLPPTTSDREAMEAVWQHYSDRKPSAPDAQHSPTPAPSSS